MAITVHPYKLTARELEARVQGEAALLPGQLLRFEGPVLAYGEVSGVRSLPTEAGGQSGECLAKIHLLFGQLDLTPHAAVLLEDAQMAQEVQRMQEPFENPLYLGDCFTGEFFKLGPLTLIEGDDFLLKYDALMMLIEAIEPYQRMLILDPLGVFPADGRVNYYRAGEDIRLSVRDVGSKRFLSAFGVTFPDSLRDLALQAVANHLPPDLPDFIAFSQYLQLEQAELPVKNLILQNYYSALAAEVFAETPQQVFGLDRVVGDHLNVVDLSAMPEPWKTLFYEELCHLVFQNAGGDVVPILIYPENYLNNLDAWVQKADEGELNLVVLASPYPPELLSEMASNLLTAEARESLHIEGELTLGLPVNIPLPEHQPLVGERQELEMAEPDWDHVLEGSSGQTPTPAQAQRIVRQPVVDLSAPAPEPGLPVSDWQSPEPDVTDYPELPESPESSEESSETGEPAPVVASSPWSAGPAASATVSPPPLPAVESLENEEFSFDVNLDQQPEESWGAYAGSGVPAGVSQSLSGFETLEQPEESREPAPVFDLGPDAQTTPSAYETYEVPLDLSEAGTEDGEEAEPSFPESPALAELGEPVPVLRKASEPKASAGSGFQPGDRVRHEQYGLGVVSKVLPMDDNVILNIQFESVGKRLLDPALCKLTKELS